MNLSQVRLAQSLLVGCLVIGTLGCGVSSSKTIPVPADNQSESGESTGESLASAWDGVAGAKTKLRGDDVVVVDLREVAESDLDDAVKLLSNTSTVSELFVPAAAWTDGMVLRLAALPHLKRLRVYGKSFDDAKAKTISGLPALIGVTFQDTSVTDEGASVLAELNELQEASLMNSPVTDKVLESISSLPKLAKLNLRGTQVTGDAFDPISKLPLKDLELAETDFGPQGMPAIAKIEGLEKINLWLTKIDNESLKAFEGKASLTILNIDNCPAITEEAIPVIVSLPHLKLLHLGKTSVAPDSLPQLEPLQELETLFVTNLGLEEAPAKELEAMFPNLKRFEY
ncbi:putative adenylate cyclase regulatory protein [Rhodopirellula islandica]|uniref:Adenylate cyclase regulatory protein n=1 Tax=Rhodopirellula islandica TaxID=595434 RepID=A0A0J1BJ20_RHOIS|nr:G protein-coupled receptor LGR4 [Rhodopirellula islandica]KLU06551.1 putative adenylate cyclase regulatory protein [Rhodopirellula islandica]